jgi:hypothetical protein
MKREIEREAKRIAKEFGCEVSIMPRYNTRDGWHFDIVTTFDCGNTECVAFVKTVKDACEATWAQLQARKERGDA